MTTEAPRRNLVGRVVLLLLAGLGALTLLGILLVVLVSAVVAGTSERVPRQVILELDLEAGVTEHVPDDPLAEILTGRTMTVRGIVDALHQAAEDDRVVGLVGRIGGGGMGAAQVEEIRDAIRAFREAGKPAIAFSETFGEFASGQMGYFMATAFDEIYLQPSGDVGLAGFASEHPFVRGTLEMLELEPRLDHRHEYKNALNLFTEEAFTEPHREATETLLESIHAAVLEGIVEGRDVTPERARALIDGGPYWGREALDAGLVDGLAYRDEVFDSLQARVGERARFLFLSRYADRVGARHRRGETVALVHGVGAVVRGKSEYNPLAGQVMGAETVTRALREAIEDDAVKAIVLRIDSPGGSYVASDAIWRETVRAREAGKPVIATMGNVAASGGYFVAMSANRIVAQPSTLTGSIGVLGGKMLTTGLWERFGVTWDLVEVGERATMWSTVQDYAPDEWQRIQAWLDRVYDDFTAKVAEGRGLDPARMDEVARGRVWTGRDALRLGLVDELGGFETALRLAREEAGIDPDAAVRVRVFPARRGLVDMILERGGPESSRPTATEVLLGRTLRATQPLLGALHQLGLGRDFAPLGAPEAIQEAHRRR